MKKWAELDTASQIALISLLVAIPAAIAAILAVPGLMEWIRSLFTVDCAGDLDIDEFLRRCP